MLRRILKWTVRLRACDTVDDNLIILWEASVPSQDHEDRWCVGLLGMYLLSFMFKAVYV